MTASSMLQWSKQLIHESSSRGGSGGDEMLSAGPYSRLRSVSDSGEPDAAAASSSVGARAPWVAANPRGPTKASTAAAPHSSQRQRMGRFMRRVGQKRERTAASHRSRACRDILGRAIVHRGLSSQASRRPIPGGDWGQSSYRRAAPARVIPKQAARLDAKI